MHAFEFCNKITLRLKIQIKDLIPVPTVGKLISKVVQIIALISLHHFCGLICGETGRPFQFKSLRVISQVAPSERRDLYLQDMQSTNRCQGEGEETEGCS